MIFNITKNTFRKIIAWLLSCIIIFTTVAITSFDVLATDNITEKNNIIFENADFSSSTGIDEISFSGSNTNTVELPAV